MDLERTMLSEVGQTMLEGGETTLHTEKALRDWKMKHATPCSLQYIQGNLLTGTMGQVMIQSCTATLRRVWVSVHKFYSVKGYAGGRRDEDKGFWLRVTDN